MIGAIIYRAGWRTRDLQLCLRLANARQPELASIFISRDVFKMYFVKENGLHVAIYMQILQHCSQFTLCVGLGQIWGQV